MKINLGAGNHIEEGFVNHDLKKHRPEIDVAWDLNVLPWPWEDETADQICSMTVFEHLDIDLVAALDECWRILRPGGILYVKLPNAYDAEQWADPTHRRVFTLNTFKFFDITKQRKTTDFYTDRLWYILDEGFTGWTNKITGIRSSVFAELQKPERTDSE